MNNILRIALLSLILSVNAHAKDGFGPIKFTSSSYQSFIEYITGEYVPNQTGVLQGKGGMPLGFAINQEGDTVSFYYCPRKFGDNCKGGAWMDAQNMCTKRSKKKGKGRCFVFAKGRKIVWDSVSIKIPKKPTNEQFKEIFAKNDWYGDTKSKDISKPKITKKKKKETKKVTKNSSDLINKLKDLKELRDNDVLTDEEFLKAKKKLLE
jgi:hypothetical protein